MKSRKNRSVFFHSSLLKSNMSVNEALLFSHLCYLDCNQSTIKTFRKSLGSYLLLSKDTISHCLNALQAKRLISVVTIDPNADGLEKHRFQVTINCEHETIRRFYLNIKRIISSRFNINPVDKLNLICVDLAVIEQSLKQYGSSSAHLHKACVAYGILNNISQGKKIGLRGHLADTSHVTVDIRHRILANQLNICLNTAKALVRTLLDAKCLVITKICTTTRILSVVVADKINSIRYQLKKALSKKRAKVITSNTKSMERVQTLLDTKKATSKQHLKFLLSVPSMYESLGIAEHEVEDLLKHL